MQDIPIAPVDLERVTGLFDSADWTEFLQHAERARELLSGRVVWNINSTAQGGGVAEMLQPLIAYTRALGCDVRWLVMEGQSDFFDVTKRMHNHLHDHPGDGGTLAAREHEIYREVMRQNEAGLRQRIGPNDLVICHDPQTAGLLETVVDCGALAVWRCHIGHDQDTALTRGAWSFLSDYLTPAQAYVFSRQAYVPQQLADRRTWIIQPSLDPLSPKNQQMDDATVNAILVKAGIVDGSSSDVPPAFIREDGSRGVVERCADILQVGKAPDADRRLVVQISRWDHLKDPLGVMQGFASIAPQESASLVLAGPDVSAVADDPEGALVLEQVREAWRQLTPEIRQKVHIVCVPMEDREENAAIVNALQRHAAIIVQKSLYEGFGLTVTEAMWKTKPIVASAVGGIQDQIEHGRDGLLLQDPTDVAGFGDQIQSLLRDDATAANLARNARERAEREFLFTRHLRAYADMFALLLT